MPNKLDPYGKEWEPEKARQKSVEQARKLSFQREAGLSFGYHSVSKHRNKAVRSAYDRRRKKVKKIEKTIQDRERELARLEKEIVAKEELSKLKEASLTPAQQRAAIEAMFRQHDFNPMEELLLLATGKGDGSITDKDRKDILKFLAEYQAPKPKSIDIQADHKMNVSVVSVDFSKVSQRQVLPAKVMEVAEEAAYDEFEQEENG